MGSKRRATPEQLRETTSATSATPVLVRRQDQATGQEHNLLHLQQQVGNQGVLSMLGAQAKLSVGAAHDPLESEADRAAEAALQALRSPAPDGPDRSAGEPEVTRLAVRRRGAPGPGGPMGPEGGDLSPEVEHALDSARSSGSAMSSELTGKMGNAFGADFSGVRIHTGSESSQLNRQLGAEAFTVGRDIFFRDGMPDTGNSSGQRLMAHELAHTVQQGASPVQPDRDGEPGRRG